jgi:hypothetical protein
MKLNFFKTINISLVAVLILLFLFLTHFFPMGWNDKSRLATVQSLVEKKSFVINDSVYIKTGDKVMIGGQFYSDKPPVLNVISALPYSILYNLGITFKYHSVVVVFVTTVFASLLPFLLFFSLFYYFGKNNFLTKNKKILLLISLAIGTTLLPYTTVVNNHIPAASLVGIALLLLYYKEKTKNNLFWVGLLLSLATTFDPGVVFILVFFSLYVLYLIIREKQYKNLIYYFIGIIIPFLLHAVFNVSITGDIVPASMHPEFFNYPNSPFNTENLTSASLAVSSFKDWLKYLYLLLFSQRGFLLNNPLIIFAIALSVYLFFKEKTTKKYYILASLFSVLAIICYYSLYGKGAGGPSYSIRWFLVFIPALLIIVFDWIDNIKKYLLVIFLGLAMLIPNISATSKVFNYANTGQGKYLVSRAVKAFPKYAVEQSQNWYNIFIKLSR